ncbi:MAG: hypothetical protein HWN67_12850 [Candidatus Helarchaeota archaeon]|nr:hypothetical protein [Candidatus Helarchaeota archaeon]
MVKSIKKKKSSIELGIINKLKKEEKFIEWIIAEYVVSVNSKWHSYDFPSSQLTKLVLKILNKPKTKFSINHRLVKEILKKWEKKGICIYVVATKYAHCRGKTKLIYRFTDNGLKKIKELIIDMIINSIKGDDSLLLKLSEKEIMKTREKILDDFLFDFQERIESLVSTGEIDNNE